MFFLFSVYPKGLKGHILLHVAKLEEVSEVDFRSNFTCFAQNSVGNATAVIQLKRKRRGKTRWRTICPYRYILIYSLLQISSPLTWSMTF